MPTFNARTEPLTTVKDSNHPTNAISTSNYILVQPIVQHTLNPRVFVVVRVVLLTKWVTIHHLAKKKNIAIGP